MLVLQGFAGKFFFNRNCTSVHNLPAAGCIAAKNFAAEKWDISYNDLDKPLFTQNLSSKKIPNFSLIF
jgi:hypothetical protein